MKFILKFAKTVRNNWKKSIVFTGLGIYGVKYLHELYEDDLLRRQYVQAARVYGDQKYSLGDKNRKITVFLNPAARGGRSRKQFEKNAAPVLYVAGIEVNVVKTEYEGQVKEFFKYLESEHVDGIVVAGGNGTVLEAVTGMMRKENEAFCRKVPIGIIPIGDTNKFASFFYGSDKGEVRRMLDAAMAVVTNDTQKMDVLKIEGDAGKTTYALCGLEAGGFRDASQRASKYWYFGRLKHHFSHLRNALFAWPPTLSGTLEYTEVRETDVPVAPSSRQQQQQQQQQTVVKPKQGWLSSIMSPFMQKQAAEKAAKQDDAEVEYEYENTHTVQRDINTVELTLSTNFDNPTHNQHMKGFTVGVGPSEITKGDFISEGVSRRKNNVWKLGSETNKNVLCRKLHFSPHLAEGKEKWYSIDGEQFEAMSIDVTLLKNKLKFFKPHPLPS